LPGLFCWPLLDRERSIAHNDNDNQFQLGGRVKKDREKFVRYLESQELKYTRPREVIVEAFLKSCKHLGVDELFVLAKKVDRSIGYATVHRTMRLLKEAGLARELDFGEGKKRYEHLVADHHDHFICLKCNRVIEFFDPVIEKRQEALCRQRKFKNQSHRLQIFGVCKDCNEKGS